MTTPFDPASLSITEIDRLQNDRRHRQPVRPYLVHRAAGAGADTRCFGRGDNQQAQTTHDIILALNDPIASEQICRRHFKLRSSPEGYILKALSTQRTEVDGTVQQRDQEHCSDASVTAPMIRTSVPGETLHGQA